MSGTQTQQQQTGTSSIPLEGNQQLSSSNQQSSSSNQQSSSGNQQSNSGNQPSSSGNQQSWGRPISSTGEWGGRPFSWQPEWQSTYPWPGAASTPQRNTNRGGVSWNTNNQEGYFE